MKYIKVFIDFYIGFFILYYIFSKNNLFFRILSKNNMVLVYFGIILFNLYKMFVRFCILRYFLLKMFIEIGYDVYF